MERKVLVLTTQPPPACHIIHVRTSELNKVFTVGGATLAAEIEGKAMNSKRGRREEEGSEEVPITCHGHKTLPSHAAKILRQLLTFCQSSDSEIALYCRFRQTASQGIAVSRISALRGQIYPVLGCLFLSSFDNVPACFPPHISEPHLFFRRSRPSQ